jgi:hypothetical protein
MMILPAAPDPFDLGIDRERHHWCFTWSQADGSDTILTTQRRHHRCSYGRAARPKPSLVSEQQPVSIIESANDLARERVEEYNAKLMVFQAFCAKFEEAAQQFTNGPQRRFAQHFADSFLDSWKRELSNAGPTTPKPTYSSVSAASPPTNRDRLTY